MSVPARFFTTVARRSLRPSSARLASSSPILSNFRVALPLRPSSILSQIPRRCFASEVSSSDAPAAAADASASTPSTHDSPDSEAPGATFGRPPKPPSPPQSPLPGDQSSEPIGKIERPSYQLTFTCKPCGHRSSHVVTKQAYHFGTTLIKCPSCMDRHVISDHLKVCNGSDFFIDSGEGPTN